MRRFRFLPLLAALVLFAGGSSVEAGIITNLFSTGVNGANVKLAAGATDAHYTITGPAGTPSGQAIVIPVNPGYPVAPNSQFITAPTSNFLNQPGGNYIYATTFTDSDSSGFISGSIAADDNVVVFLNNSQLFFVSTPAYNSFTNFSITTGFVAGLNTLTFFVNNNSGGSQGLDVNFGAAVPEPASVAMLGLALAGVGTVARMRRRV